MMKKFLFLILIIMCINLKALADVTPYYISNISTETIGLYQAPKELKIYTQPNENSNVILTCTWNYQEFNCPKTSISNLFTVFIQAKELAFIPVISDYGDWIEVIYDRNSNKKGWIKKDEQDPYRIMNLRTFYNLYGRKYGIYLLKDAPESIKNLHTSTTTESSVCDQINNPLKIKLLKVNGNFMLIQAYEKDSSKKTGYMQWRDSSTGEIYAFPAIK